MKNGGTLAHYKYLEATIKGVIAGFISSIQ